MADISSYNSKLHPIYLLHTEKIADAVLPYVFRMVFSVSLFTLNVLNLFDSLKKTVKPSLSTLKAKM